MTDAARASARQCRVDAAAQHGCGSADATPIAPSGLSCDRELGKEVIEAELLHSGVITYFAPVEEFLGTDLERPGGIQMCEAPVRLRWNGEEGVGIRERVARTTTLY